MSDERQASAIASSTGPFCVECGEDAEGARCDDCGDALCLVCITEAGVTLCGACQDEPFDEDDGPPLAPTQEGA